MADTSSPYLEDVPGYKDARLRGGSLLPRRNILEIDGARVVDDAVGAQTRIELRMPFVERRVELADYPGASAAAFVAENDDSDGYRFVDVTDLIGLAPPRVGGRVRVWIFNADPSTAMDVEHQHASAPATSRIVTLTGAAVSIAANGGMRMMIYRASRWHLVG